VHRGSWLDQLLPEGLFQHHARATSSDEFGVMNLVCGHIYLVQVELPIVRSCLLQLGGGMYVRTASVIGVRD
jgi:hypothetical protein